MTDLAKSWERERLARMAAAPAVKIIWGKDWGWGPEAYSFGVEWDKNLTAPEGCNIYRRRMVLHLTFRLSFERAAPHRRFPSSCCQTCGQEIGWLGRLLQPVLRFNPFHFH